MPYLTGSAPNAGIISRRLRIPNDTQFLANVSGAILELCADYNWDQFESLTPEQSADLAWDMYRDFSSEGNVFMIGTMFPFASAVTPEHTLECDGSAYLRVDYPDLYAAIDIAFVVDADSFVVPDMRNRVSMGSDYPSGSTYPIGSTGGESTHTLTGFEVPSHTHTDSGHVHVEGTTLPVAIPQGGGVPIPASFGSVGSTLPGYASLDSFGGDGSHNNLQPYLALRWAIVAE